MNHKTIRTHTPAEGIDVNKLSVVIRTNWFWLLLIFTLVNSCALLYLRYTKNLYESSSELKLDVNDDATEIGIKSVVEDQNVNLLSGEIEIIQSKLFLSRVLENAPLDISYFSVGRVLNEELFTSTPFTVTYTVKDPAILDIPVYLDGIDAHHFKLRIGENKEVNGSYGKPLILDIASFTIYKNNAFKPGDEVGYFFTLNSKEVLLQYLIKNLTAEPLNYNANTIRIAFKGYNAHKAQAILQKIDTLYLHFSNEQKNLANRQKIEWLSNELALIETKMEGYEDYFENFTLQHKTNNLDEDLAKTVERINLLDSQRYNLSERIERFTKLYDDLQDNTFKNAFTNRRYLPEQLNQNLDKIQELVLEQEKLKMSYREVTFAYREKEKTLENLRRKVLAQLGELRSEDMNRLAELNQRKNRLEREFANLPDKNTQFTKNMRFYKLNEQLYLSLMQAKSEFEIMQAGSTPDFKILSPATLPTTPISPKKALILGAGAVASFMAILFVTGILYLANNKITSLAELENAIDLPVLGMVPASGNIKQSGLFVLEHPRSRVSEAIRTLRTNLEFFHPGSDKRVIAISSTVSGEGKSFIAMNLGAMIGLSNKRVILLDLDMRKPKTNLPLQIHDHTKGISTILIRKNTWEECCIETEVPSLDYLPSGPHPPNPAELLLSTTFTELLENLKTQYDYILLDTPPVGLLTDGIMAMKQADLSIYIFRANYSKRDFISNLRRIITINKFSTITMVLNALPSGGERKYGYGYYDESPRPGIPKWKQLLNV